MAEQMMSSESVTQDRVEPVLTELAISDSAKFVTHFREFKDKFPNEVVRACVFSLGTGADECCKSFIFQCAQSPKYFGLLFDPNFLPLDKAVNAATILRNDDRRFFTRFPLLSSDELHGNSQRIGRALEVLERIGGHSVLFSWLHGLANHENERVRSKAVKLFCKIRPNELLVQRQLTSRDCRIRANTVEALWGETSQESTGIFRNALSDSAHRVVVNALIGLYYQKDSAAKQTLGTLTRHPSEMFRLAAAWACEFLSDPQAIPFLEPLLEDESKLVRERARAALASISIARC